MAAKKSAPKAAPKAELPPKVQKAPRVGKPAATADVVVIGGGHNGLVAAAYLARAGVKTILVEARTELGGMALTGDVFGRCADYWQIPLLLRWPQNECVDLAGFVRRSRGLSSGYRITGRIRSGHIAILCCGLGGSLRHLILTRLLSCINHNWFLHASS